MKKTIKLISVLMTILMIATVTIPVLATTIDGVSVNPNMDKIKNSTVGNSLSYVLGALRYVGIFAAVAILMIIGIKYMMGSAEEKAEYKKTLIPYILGAILLFAASFIVGVIADGTAKVIV